MELKETLLKIKKELRKYIIVSIRVVYNTETYSNKNKNTIDELKEF